MFMGGATIEEDEEAILGEPVVDEENGVVETGGVPNDDQKVFEKKIEREKIEDA
jgi:hypothetical protein